MHRYLEVSHRVHFHFGDAAVRVPYLDHHRELGRRDLRQSHTSVILLYHYRECSYDD